MEIDLLLMVRTLCKDYWRPPAVMSTTWLESYYSPRILKERRERTGPDKGVELYQLLNPISGQSDFRVASC